MSGHVQLELWFHEYKLEALSSVLEEQGSSVEERMHANLNELYTGLVPPEVQQDIRQKIDAEQAAGQSEIEASRKYTVFCVRENGSENFFQLDRQEDFLDVAKRLRWCLQQESGSLAETFVESAADLKPIKPERFRQFSAQWMTHYDKNTGIFDLDFDQKIISTLTPAEDWEGYAMKDVSASVWSACQKSSLSEEQYKARFVEHLANRRIDPSFEGIDMESLWNDEERAFTGARIKEILPKLSAPDTFDFIHEAEVSAYFNDDLAGVSDAPEPAYTVLSAPAMLKLTPTGQQEYAALMDAQVQEIRCTPCGVVAIVTDVEPQEVARLANDYTNFMEAEEQMGPVM